jgi:exopolysaccharide production protein ExoZ
MTLPVAARMDSVQTLRGIAALSVVLFHATWIGISSFGVELFFVLSGFIICHAAAKEPDGFMLKRACRVIPLYALATIGVFVGALIVPSLFTSSQPTLWNLARSLLFIPYVRADGVMMPLLFLGWTLNYEMLFYVIFAMALMISRRFAPAIAALVIVLLASAHSLLAPLSAQLDFWTKPVIVDFFVGIIAYLIWSKHSGAIQKLPVAIASGLAFAMLSLLVMGLPHGVSASIPIKALLGGVLLLASLRLDGAIKWPAAMLLVGDASYSLYLLHPYVVQAIGKLAHPLDASPLGILFTIAAVALAILVAILSFRMIERPSNRSLRNYFDQRSLRPLFNIGI